MAKKTLTVGIPDYLFDMITPAAKASQVEAALMAYFDVNPFTLESGHSKKAKPVVATLPKSYAACKDDDERIAFRESEGAILGGHKDFPDVWLMPNGMLWHYDSVTSRQANLDVVQAQSDAELAAMFKPTSAPRLPPSGKIPISQSRLDGFMALAEGDEDAIALLERKYEVDPTHD